MAALALLRWLLYLIGACLFVVSATLIGGTANWAAGRLLHDAVPVYRDNNPVWDTICGAITGLVTAVAILRDRRRLKPRGLPTQPSVPPCGRSVRHRRTRRLVLRPAPHSHRNAPEPRTAHAGTWYEGCGTCLRYNERGGCDA